MRRRGRDRRRARGGGGGRRAEARQPAPDPDADGGARRGRDLRALDRPVHGLDDLAGPAHHAPADDGVRVRDPGEQDALHRAPRRRRLRDEDLPLPRVRAHGRARGEGRAARQVDGDEDGELRRDDARPRPHHVPGGRREARRDDHGAEGEDVRQPRRRPVDDRAGDPDDALRADAIRRVPDPQHPLPGPRRVHEHRHGRRVPRRRQAGSDVRRRACG